MTITKEQLEALNSEIKATKEKISGYIEQQKQLGETVDEMKIDHVTKSEIKKLEDLANELGKIQKSTGDDINPARGKFVTQSEADDVVDWIAASYPELARKSVEINKALKSDSNKYLQKDLLNPGETDGSLLVPTTFDTTIYRAVDQFGASRRYLDIIDNVIGKWDFIKENETSQHGEFILAEGTDEVKEIDPSYSQFTLDPDTLGVTVRVTGRMLQQSRFNLANELIGFMGRVMARTEDRINWLADGSANVSFNSIRGFAHATGVQAVDTTESNLFSAPTDEPTSTNPRSLSALSKAMSEISDYIWQGSSQGDMNSVAWYGDSRLRHLLSGITDADGNPIFHRATEATPDMLLGYPYRIINAMTSTNDTTSGGNDPVLIVGNLFAAGKGARGRNMRLIHDPTSQSHKDIQRWTLLSDYDFEVRDTNAYTIIRI